MGVMDNFHFPYSIFHIPYSISIMGVMDIFHIPYHILCPYDGEWTICFISDIKFIFHMSMGVFPIYSIIHICPWGQIMDYFQFQFNQAKNAPQQSFILSLVVYDTHKSDQSLYQIRRLIMCMMEICPTILGRKNLFSCLAGGKFVSKSQLRVCNFDC